MFGTINLRKVNEQFCHQKQFIIKNQFLFFINIFTDIDKENNDNKKQNSKSRTCLLNLVQHLISKDELPPYQKFGEVLLEIDASLKALVTWMRNNKIMMEQETDNKTKEIYQYLINFLKVRKELKMKKQRQQQQTMSQDQSVQTKKRKTRSSRENIKLENSPIVIDENEQNQIQVKLEAIQKAPPAQQFVDTANTQSNMYEISPNFQLSQIGFMLQMYMEMYKKANEKKQE